MAKKRRMIFIPEVHPGSFVFFFERGSSGNSWSIRDYSVRNRVREYGPHDFRWTADQIHQKSQHSVDAPTHHTDDLDFWHEHTNSCNRKYLEGAVSRPAAETRSILRNDRETEALASRSNAFPVLNLHALLNSPKGKKSQDIDRILHSPNSEDWVTWNFFQIMFHQYPNGWLDYLLSAVRRRNCEFNYVFDQHTSSNPTFWLSVPSPSEYESQSRIRMRESNSPDWALRASNPEPVEGPSEIDVSFDHDRFLIYVEAKLGSDVSMRTTYDPQRNQIIRNIDCLLEMAGHREPLFWMLVRDDEPRRAYVQLMTTYTADPGLLSRDLPHRNPEKLKAIAQNLTIILWNDLKELVCGPGWDETSMAVKRELERRITSLKA